VVSVHQVQRPQQRPERRREQADDAGRRRAQYQAVDGRRLRRGARRVRAHAEARDDGAEGVPEQQNRRVRPRGPRGEDELGEVGDHTGQGALLAASNAA